MDLIFNLPGDWPNPYLLFRLLEVVDSPWNAGEGAFTHRETGEQVSLGFGPKVPDLGLHFSRGTDPSRNPMSDAVLEALDAHLGMFQVQAPSTDEPLQGLRTALRAVNAVVDGGATAVQIVGSGLVHEADAFQALMRDVDEGSDLKRALYQLVVRYQFGKLPMTFGMAYLGLPDLVIPSPTQADRAIGLLERAALSDDLVDRAVDDSRGLPEHARNAYGMVVLQP